MQDSEGNQKILRFIVLYLDWERRRASKSEIFLLYLRRIDLKDWSSPSSDSTELSERRKLSRFSICGSSDEIFKTTGCYSFMTKCFFMPTVWQIRRSVQSGTRFSSKCWNWGWLHSWLEMHLLINKGTCFKEEKSENHYMDWPWLFAKISESCVVAA